MTQQGINEEVTADLKSDSIDAALTQAIDDIDELVKPLVAQTKVAVLSEAARDQRWNALRGIDQLAHLIRQRTLRAIKAAGDAGIDALLGPRAEAIPLGDAAELEDDPDFDIKE